MKARWIVVIIALLVSSSTMGCALYRLVSQQPTTSPKVVQLPTAPVVTVHVTMTPTRVPTASATPKATQTSVATATPPPTDTPAATNTPQATDTPEPAQEQAPAPPPKPPSPTPPPPPPTEPPKPKVGQHGTETTFELVNPKPEYENSSAVKLRYKIKNLTPQKMLFGILGVNLPLKMTATGFQSLRSSKYEEILEGGEINGESTVYPVRFNPNHGPATLTLSMCFSKLDACQQPGADWEVIADPITIQIVP